MAMMAASRGHQGLAAADVALQQAVHGMRRGHVADDLAQHAFLRRGGLEREHSLDLLPRAVRQREGDAGLLARRRALERQTALQPEELLEDHPELRRRAECVQQPEILVLRREVKALECRPAVEQLEAPPDRFGKRVVDRGERLENGVQEFPEDPGGDLSGGLVDGHNPADVQGGIAFVVLSREDLELGMEHAETAAVAVPLHLSVERDLLPRRDDVGEVAGVEPFPGEHGAGGVRESGLEHARDRGA